MKQLAAIVLGLVLLIFIHHEIQKHRTNPQTPSAERANAPRIESVNLSQDTSCRLAVVCGGIHSLTELRQAMQSDPLVAGLYNGFDFSHARVTRLDHTVCGFIAWRKSDSIFYTHEERCVHAGEPVITDGSLLILQRCGNALRLDQPAIIDPYQAEPLGIYPPASLVPVNYEIPPSTPPSPPIYNAPPNEQPPSAPRTYLYPPVYPPCCIVGPPSSNPPVNVPEPGTFVLLAVGIAALCLIRIFGSHV
jgi:PEP-CTERM motif